MLYWVNQFAVVDDQPGGTRHVEMARQLHADGLDVRVVASDFNLSRRCYTRRRGAWDLRHLEEGVGGPEFVWLPAGSYKRNDWRRAASMVLFSFHVLIHLLTASMPPGSLVIGSSPHLPGALAAWLAAQIQRVPFVLEVRDLWPESLAVEGARHSVLHRILRATADLLYRRSDAIVVLAPGSIDAIVDRGIDRGRITYIPNGVDAAAFDAAMPARPAGVPDDAQLLVYAGTHGPANDLETVLRAMHGLATRDANVHLVLVGDGPAKPGLERTAGELGLDNVTFLDPVPKSQIPSLLKGCDVGVMPLADVELFRRAVSPNKLFDYLCAGLRVVSNVPGVVEDMVTSSASGVSCGPGDPAALADATLAALELPTSDAGRRWVEDAHSRDGLAEQLLHVIHDVAPTARARQTG